MPDAWPQPQLDALLAEGAIGYQRCEACAAPIHHPRVLCPRCGSTALRRRIPIVTSSARSSSARAMTPMPSSTSF